MGFSRNVNFKSINLMEYIFLLVNQVSLNKYRQHHTLTTVINTRDLKQKLPIFDLQDLSFLQGQEKIKRTLKTNHTIHTANKATSNSSYFLKLIQQYTNHLNAYLKILAKNMYPITH